MKGERLSCEADRERGGAGERGMMFETTGREQGEGEEEERREDE